MKDKLLKLTLDIFTYTQTQIYYNIAFSAWMEANSSTQRKIQNLLHLFYFPLKDHKLQQIRESFLKVCLVNIKPYQKIWICFSVI